jgi:hypothetical protein
MRPLAKDTVSRVLSLVSVVLTLAYHRADGDLHVRRNDAGGGKACNSG